MTSDEIRRTFTGDPTLTLNAAMIAGGTEATPARAAETWCATLRGERVSDLSGSDCISTGIVTWAGPAFANAERHASATMFSTCAGPMIRAL